MEEESYPNESSDLLKEWESEREQMTNQIFNMRLRINFLEEKLLMYEAGKVVVINRCFQRIFIYFQATTCRRMRKQMNWFDT